MMEGCDNKQRDEQGRTAHDDEGQQQQKQPKKQRCALQQLLDRALSVQEQHEEESSSTVDPYVALLLSSSLTCGAEPFPPEQQLAEEPPTSLPSTSPLDFTQTLDMSTSVVGDVGSTASLLGSPHKNTSGSTSIGAMSYQHHMDTTPFAYWQEEEKEDAQATYAMSLMKPPAMMLLPPPPPPRNTPTSSSDPGGLMHCNHHQQHHHHKDSPASQHPSSSSSPPPKSLMLPQPATASTGTAMASPSSFLMTSEPGSIRAWINNNSLPMSLSMMADTQPTTTDTMPIFTESSAGAPPVSPPSTLQSTSSLQLQRQQQQQQELCMRERELQLLQLQANIATQLDELRQIQQLQQSLQQGQQQDHLMSPLDISVPANNTWPLDHHHLASYMAFETAETAHPQVVATAAAPVPVSDCSSLNDNDPVGGKNKGSSPYYTATTTKISPTTVPPTKGHWKKDPATAFLKKRDKNTDRPKRPLSAYNLFFKDERAKMVAAGHHHRHQHRGKTDRATTALTEENSSCNFTNDDEYISRQRADTTMSSSSSTTTTTRTQQASLKQKSGAAFVSMAQTVATRWKNIDEQVLAEYKQMAASDKARYDREIQFYRAQQEQELHEELQQQGHDGLGEEGVDEE